MVVNEQGEILTDSQPPKSEEQSIGTNEAAAFGGEQATEGSDPMPMSKEHEEFINYKKKIRKAVVMPIVGDPNFCQNMRAFIETRGDGMASSNQLIEAYNLFQENCVERKKEENKADEQTDGGKQEESKEIAALSLPAPPVSEIDGQPEDEAVSPIIEEYLTRDKKLTTFDDNLGMRPNIGESLEEREFRIKKVNGDPMLYFLVILGVAAMVYAISKKD